jgi:hypothetical protein
MFRSVSSLGDLLAGGISINYVQEFLVQILNCPKIDQHVVFSVGIINFPNDIRITSCRSLIKQYDFGTPNLIMFSQIV